MLLNKDLLMKRILDIQTEVRNGNLAVSRMIDEVLAQLEKAEEPEICDHVYVAAPTVNGGWPIAGSGAAMCVKCGYRPGVADTSAF